jgi:FtsP/CotA-like multicopper oxidase with cupredoxin domain
MIANVISLAVMFYIGLVLVNNCDGLKFSNEVKYPQKKDIYEFYFDISEALTMSIWNASRNAFRPVVKINNSFYVRIKDSSEACNSMTKINHTLADSVIKAAGKHKYILTVNQMLPGTPIVVPLNSTVRITTKNNLLQESISIHWHGQSQKNSFYMDGVARLTQCSIGPGETYVYTFTASEIGTHWYHSHSGVQRTDGLAGPFIVTNSYSNGEIVDATQPIYNYDKEFYFMVQEWFQKDSKSIYNHVLWEEIKFSNGFENLSSCYYSNRMDDGTEAPMIPFNRKSDAILVNGKVTCALDEIRDTFKSRNNAIH